MTRTANEEPRVPDLVRELGETLQAMNWKMAVAESCTGGGLGAAVTDQAGSSAYFLGGVIAYDNRLKHSLLGVSEDELERYGAVSLEVAERMASGCRRRLGADLAVSITGIAGPGGATPGKPVGLVFIGVATAAATRAQELHFTGDRADVRRQAIVAALRVAVEAARRESDAAP
jgi:nicotinamide-nucleotide amidase